MIFVNLCLFPFASDPLRIGMAIVCFLPNRGEVLACRPNPAAAVGLR